MNLTGRSFLVTALGLLLVAAKRKNYSINTINGRVSVRELGTSLIHEHFLVDFIGSDKISFDRWDRDQVLAKVVPYALEAKQAGVKSIFDCTPNFLGRDIGLLKMISNRTGLTLVTNTGYYGAVGNKYLPSWAFTETAEQLAIRWIGEFENGIEGTDVKPGFIKIGVEASPDGLSEIHKKLVQAAGLTHLKTGLTICSHTGPGLPALEEIDILKKMEIHPSAFVWVHAQAEVDKTIHTKAASMGAWISLDGIGWGDFDDYADSIHRLKRQGYLDRVLISHDAGWYKPDEPAAEFKGYTNIFSELIPRLKNKGFTQKELNQLLIENPAEAFGMRVRKL
jgi:phosphotriesterase-related protein